MLPASHTGLSRALPAINIAAAVLLWGLPAWAQTAVIELAPARQAYQIAEQWVRQGSTVQPAPALAAANVRAVHVTLRMKGMKLGRGAAAMPKPLDTAEPTADLTDLLRRAADQALREARGNFADLQRRSKTDQSMAPFADIAQQLTLDLQLAGPPSQLVFDEPKQLPSLFVMGLHGLAMRQEGRWAWAFPGSAIAANTDLRGQLMQLLNQLNLPVRQLANLGQSGGPRLYRFDLVHMVRPSPGAPVASLHRGNQLLRSGPISERSLRDLGDRWAHVLIRRQGGDGRFAGTYLPTMDQFDPAVAPHTDAAMACYALARYARASADRPLRAELAGDAARHGLEALIEDLHLTADGQRQSDEPMKLAQAAMTLSAILETPDAAPIKPARDVIADALRTMQTASGRFRTDESGASEPVSLPVQALGAATMVQLYDLTRDDDDLTRARNALQVIWNQLRPQHITGAMPWLLMAEFNLTQLDQPSVGGPVVPRACEALWRLQIHATDASVADVPLSPDTIGGFANPRNVIKEPTWRSASLLAALTPALSVRHFVGPDDQPRWIVDASLGARFLKQLTMERPNCYYTRNTAEAMGGVRLAFWDNRQPLAATAMSLLAVTELQVAFRQLAAQD